MSTRQVKFGLVGAGEIVRVCLPAFKDNPTMKAVAVADVNLDAAKKLAGEIGVTKVFADHSALLKDAEVEAVYIATPPFLHKQMIFEALAARKHVICEKPLAMNAGEVEAIARATREASGLKVAGCSSRFLLHAALLARDIIQGGALGKLERVGFLTSRAAVPAPLPWAGWKADASKAGGGLLMDWAVYDLDWLSFVMGEQFRPTRILATIGRMRSGVESNYAVQMFCDDGLRIDLQRRGGEHGPAKDVVEFRGSAGGLDVAMTPSESPPVQYQFDESTQALKHTPLQTPWLREWKDSMAWPIQDLANAIIENRAPLSQPDRLIQVHRIIDAAYHSARSGQVEAIA